MLEVSRILKTNNLYIMPYYRNNYIKKTILNNVEAAMSAIRRSKSIKHCIMRNAQNLRKKLTREFDTLQKHYLFFE